MTYEVFDTPQEAAKKLAAEVADLIRSRAAEGKGVVLGLATGATPLPFYAELIRLHKEEGLSFQNVTTFNLDEYTGLPHEHKESYWYFMHRLHKMKKGTGEILAVNEVRVCGVVGDFARFSRRVVR